MELDLEKLIREKNMASNPVFIAIFDDAAKRLNEINTILMNDETLDTAARNRLFDQKKVWKFNFDRFGMTLHDNAIASLEEKM